MKSLTKRPISDRYLLEGKRPRIGISELWDARDQQLERPVTIQMLAKRESAEADVCDIFLKHQRIASTVQDGALFAVYDAGVWEGRAYSVMQRLTGTPPSEIYQPGRPPDVPLALAVTRQAAEGLERCRQAGLTDWVFSPEAVLVDPEGNAWLAIIEGLAANEDTTDAAALGELLQLMLVGNRHADSAELREALVPETVIELLEGLSPTQNGRSSAGDVAAGIAELEAAAAAATQAYQLGPASGQAVSTPAAAPEAIASPVRAGPQDRSEAPTLVSATLLPEYGASGREGTAQEGISVASVAPTPVPEKKTMPLGAYMPPVSGGQMAGARPRPMPKILGISAVALLLVLGFVWLRLLNPATSVQGESARPAGTPTVAPAATSNVAVPDLRGKSLQEAVSTVQAAGLSLTQGTSDYDAAYSAGEIDSQQPAPGAQVQRGSIITVNLSLGPEPTPNIVANPPAQPTAPAPQPQNGHGGDKGKGKGKHK